MLQKIIFLSLMVAFSCKNTKQATSESVDLSVLIEEKIGDTYERIDQGTLSLCYSVDKKNMTNWKTILVIDTVSSEIIYGPKKLNAKVSWYADRKLLIKETPEVIKDKQSTDMFSYIFNLDTKEKETNTP